MGPIEVSDDDMLQSRRRVFVWLKDGMVDGCLEKEGQLATRRESR